MTQEYQVIVVQVNGADSFPFRPPGKGSNNGSLFAERPFCVTSAAKVLKKGLDMVIQQVLGPAGAGCGHGASPCDGITASRERRYDYAASGTLKSQAGRARNRSIRHNPEVDNNIVERALKRAVLHRNWVGMRIRSACQAGGPRIHLVRAAGDNINRAVRT